MRSYSWVLGILIQLWPDFLGFCAEHLSPDGVVVFITHGRQPIQWMREGFFDYGLSREEQRTLIEGYVKEGFGFVSPSILRERSSRNRHLGWPDCV
jgi:hypothetical protein